MRRQGMDNKCNKNKSFSIWKIHWNWKSIHISIAQTRTLSMLVYCKVPCTLTNLAYLIISEYADRLLTHSSSRGARPFLFYDTSTERGTNFKDKTLGTWSPWNYSAGNAFSCVVPRQPNISLYFYHHAPFNRQWLCWCLYPFKCQVISKVVILIINRHLSC